MSQVASVQRRSHVALLVLALLGVLLAVGGWWWTHATVLNGRLGGAGFDMEPRPVEQATLHSGVAMPPPRGDAHETLTFRSLELHFAENTAGATARLSVCVPRDAASVIGSVTGVLSRFCNEVRPIGSGTTMRWTGGGSPAEYVVLTIEPSRPGVARVDGIEVSYSRDREHLWQRGNATSTST